MTFDTKGHAWVAGYAGGVARFTPDDESWDVVGSVTGLGMQADGEGRVWVGSYGGMGTGVVAIDVDTLEVLDFIPIQASVTKGVSIDFFGYVWVVDQSNYAFKVDPDALTYEFYDGLNSAYTYSDMTGWGLANVADPEG
jgi:streptogramin lyase